MGKIDDWMKAALRKCGRSHKKRHSVNRERSRESSKKAKNQEKKRVETCAAARDFKDAMGAFWRGESDFHPGKFKK